MLGHREREPGGNHATTLFTLYPAVVIAAHALLVCSMCSPQIAVGILLNLRVNAVFPLYWRSYYTYCTTLENPHCFTAEIRNPAVIKFQYSFWLLRADEERDWKQEFLKMERQFLVGPTERSNKTTF